MNKEKYSKILDKYSDSLKKYGIYLLIILFFLTFSLNYLLGRVKNTSLDIDADPSSESEIVIETTKPKIEEELPVIENEPKPESKEVESTPVVIKNKQDKPVETPIEAPKVESIRESAEETNPVIITDEIAGPLEFNWPVQGEVINNFGISYSKTYDDYRLHPGLNIRTKPGIDISAVYGGKVILVEYNEAEKFIIEIDHGKGITGRYSQLAQADVKEGQTVKVEEKIGQAGSPGTEGAEESHLHFRIRQNDQWVDPLEYLQK